MRPTTSSSCTIAASAQPAGNSRSRRKGSRLWRAPPQSGVCREKATRQKGGHVPEGCGTERGPDKTSLRMPWAPP
eukprot:4994914-Prymnesium_polylepis.1